MKCEVRGEKWETRRCGGRKQAWICCSSHPEYAVGGSTIHGEVGSGVGESAASGYGFGYGGFAEKRAQDKIQTLLQTGYDNLMKFEELTVAQNRIRFKF